MGNFKAALLKLKKMCFCIINWVDFQRLKKRTICHVVSYTMLFLDVQMNFDVEGKKPTQIDTNRFTGLYYLPGKCEKQHNYVIIKFVFVLCMDLLFLRTLLNDYHDFFPHLNSFSKLVNTDSNVIYLRLSINYS